MQDPSSQDTSSFNLMLAKVIMSTGYNNNLEYQIGIEAQSETARGDRISNTSQVKSDYDLSFFAEILTTIKFCGN